MGGWKTKFVFLLIVYFAGFATGIYCLAPVPEDQADSTAERSFTHSVFKSDEFALSFNSGLHKAVDFSKDALSKAGEFIKEKLDERRADG